MSTVFVFNVTGEHVDMWANDGPMRLLPAAAPGNPPQPTSFSFSASGDGDFGTQNTLRFIFLDIGARQTCSFGIDPNLQQKADVQIFISHGFLTLIEPSGMHMISMQPLEPPQD